MTTPQIVGLLLTVPLVWVFMSAVLAKALFTVPIKEEDRSAILFGGGILASAFYGMVILNWASL